MFSCLTIPGLQLLRIPPPPFVTLNGLREARPPPFAASPASRRDGEDPPVWKAPRDDESPSPGTSPCDSIDLSDKVSSARTASDGDADSLEPVDRGDLAFSISNILSPNFGKKALRVKRVAADRKPDASGERPPSFTKDSQQMVWPAWVYCTRYSDRPSSGPRSRRVKKKERKVEDKRPRTAFTNEQLARLKQEFEDNKYLTEKRRQELSRELSLNESQIKIWFQNKRAKIKKSGGQRGSLALQLMAQGLYNHSTVPVEEEEDDEAAPSSEN